MREAFGSDDGGERLSLDLDVAPPLCAVCRSDPHDRKRLTLTVADRRQGGREVTVVVCRSCLSEYMPELLAEVEEEADWVGPS